MPDPTKNPDLPRKPSQNKPVPTERERTGDDREPQRRDGTEDTETEGKPIKVDNDADVDVEDMEDAEDADEDDLEDGEQPIE